MGGGVVTHASVVSSRNDHIKALSLKVGMEDGHQAALIQLSPPLSSISLTVFIYRKRHRWAAATGKVT